jgi:hypothetical protein
MVFYLNFARDSLTPHSVSSILHRKTQVLSIEPQRLIPGVEFVAFIKASVRLVSFFSGFASLWV